METRSDLKNDTQHRLDVLCELLRQGEASTQEELCKALKQRKLVVTQSTVSRDLRRIGAVKTVDADGQTVYKLPEERILIPQAVSHSLGGLLLDIQSNESMIVLHTSPGSASLVARHIDSLRSQLGILGTIAGDDTIFIAPKSVKKISELIKKISAEF